MTTITIKDLPENVDLDRKAMLAITGGARSGPSLNFRRETHLRAAGIINYPGSLRGSDAGMPKRRTGI